MRVRSLALLVVLIACTTRADAQRAEAMPDVGAEATIRQLERDWNNALIGNNQTVINRIVAEDCLFVSSTGELMTKSQVDVDRENTVLQLTSVTQMNVRLFGDVAVVIGTNLEKSQYAGQDTSGQYRWTDVFVKRGGRWQVVSAQSTRID